MKVVLISNDVTPAMGVPASAPGMRVAGLAKGLQANGIEAKIVIPAGRVRQVETNSGVSGLLPVPSGAMVLAAKNFAAFLETERPDATIICNSNYYDFIAGAKTGHLIFDFFAPKVLEAREAGADDTELRQIEARKRRALAAADAVIVNGAKKLDYAYGFLSLSERKARDVPVEVVNMCYDWPQRFSKRGPDAGDAELSVVVSGYVQPWLDYGKKFEQVAEALDRLPGLMLTLMMPRLEAETIAATPALKACLKHPRVKVRGPMLFEDYARLVQAHDIYLDIFAPSEERRLAMVTRSVTALGLGMPVIHPTFTEVSPLIEKAGAGWLLDLDVEAALVELLAGLSTMPAEVAAKEAGAAQLALGALSPSIAVKPLVEILRGF